MNNIKLDPRLSAVASLVRRGSKVADVGTDHGYLPAYLVLNGVSPSAVAGDVRIGPLENARKTVAELGLSDKIETVLSDGLKSFKVNCADDIIIAGMGGILIGEILSACHWVKNENIKIIVQPMTHPENTLEFFIKNSFEICEELAVSDGKHCYCVISARFTVKEKTYPAGYTYYGELIRKRDETSVLYLHTQLNRLIKRYEALTKAESQLSEINYLKNVIDDFKRVMEENK